MPVNCRHSNQELVLDARNQLHLEVTGHHMRPLVAELALLESFFKLRYVVKLKPSVSFKDFKKAKECSLISSQLENCNALQLGHRCLAPSWCRAPE